VDAAEIVIGGVQRDGGNVMFEFLVLADFES
jgi:hypothetical protein